MNNTTMKIRAMPTHTYSPPRDLYIYYLKGRIHPGNEIFSSDFIGSWEEDGFSFLFFSRPAFDQVEKILKLQAELTFLDQYQMSYEAWHGCRQRPINIGRFLIIPPWIEPVAKADPPDAELRIILDPGVVFGTGTHPTTHDCLQALELVCSNGCVNTLVDLGTGTGLLALAAAMLGCQKVLAVDSNYLAIRTTQKNIRLNQMENRILAVQGKAENFVDISSDLMIANVHFDVIKHLIASYGFLTKKWFVLSGLLRSQAEDIAFKLSQHPVKIIKAWNHDGIWHTFLGTTDANTVSHLSQRMGHVY